MAINTESETASFCVGDTGRGDLEAKIESRDLRVGIIGMGYVGLPLALLFSGAGYTTIGFDNDPRKINTLQSGGSYMARIPANDIQNALAHGFCAAGDYKLISGLDVVIICVPTPLNGGREPDLSYIVHTAESIAPHLSSGQLIVLESTTYPGTTEEILVPILERQNRAGLRAARSHDHGDDIFYVAFSPEREDPGNTTVERRNIPKVVAGLNTNAAELAGSLYGTVFSQTVRVSSLAIAEMSKLLENIYRCVNIALVNELKLLCLRMGIDLWEVIEAAKTKPFGFQAFYPGPGLGGHCIPVDPFYLSWRAKEFDFHTRFIELAGEINSEMPYHVTSAVASALNERKKTLNGARVLVLGVAYKKDIDDLRESPALTIIELLRKAGAEVRYNDPYLPFVGRGRKYDLQMHCTPLDNLGQYDCVLILTDHSIYDYRRIVEESQLIIDTRNVTRELHSSKVVYC
jgi:UDP-N-acetyl-D-glucosamine dehydrogenase